MTGANEPEDACARVRERLDVLLDGGLGAVEAARDRGHMEACEPCAAACAGRERWGESLQAALAPGAEALDFAREGLAARLGQAPAPRRGGLTLLRGRAVRRAAAAALVAASALACLALLDGLGASGAPVGELVSSAMRELEAGSLPELSWPPSTAGLWGAR